MVYALTKIFIFPILRIFVKRIRGAQNLPKKGAFILATNHQGTIDGVLILYAIASCLNRKTHVFIIKEHFTNFFTRFIFKTIYQNIKINGSLDIGFNYLKNGEIICIFPEAQRTRTGKLQKTERTGLGVMALISKAPVVPAGIKGSYEFWPAGKKLFRPKRMLEMNIGKPMFFSKKLNKKNARYVIKAVMKRIANLAGQDYQY